MSLLLGSAIGAWVLVSLLLVFGIREPRDLPSDPDAPSVGGLPSVRIVVPARNEARGISACLESLAAQEYPNFRIVVLDDRSTDDTAGLAKAVAPGNAKSIEVVTGAPLPEGWFGKPWACWQAVEGAEEDLLLFTDADTWHGPFLLARAVTAMRQDGAAAVSLVGSQTLGSFGERLIQPHVFTLLGLRFRHLDRLAEGGGERDAIANGQYILIDRHVYGEIGGHEAVRGEVVEDLRLAQRLTGAGHPLSLRSARGAFATRMYHSLGEVVDGWTKNLATGARQAAGAWGPLALAGIVAYVLVMWVAPPLAATWVLGTSPGEAPNSDLLAWGGITSLIGIGVWALLYRRYEVSPAYALLYPLGAAIVAFIAVRSGFRGSRRIEWKGRRYSGGQAQGDAG